MREVSPIGVIQFAERKFCRSRATIRCSKPLPTAVIAIGNARLIRELGRRTAEVDI
jgi:hypothetical protein